MMTLAELAAAGLSAIKSIADSLSAAHAGTITPDEAMAQIASFHTQLLADQAAADAALKARFSTP